MFLFEIESEWVFEQFVSEEEHMEKGSDLTKSEEKLSFLTFWEVKIQRYSNQLH